MVFREPVIPLRLCLTAAPRTSTTICRQTNESFDEGGENQCPSEDYCAPVKDSANSPFSAERGKYRRKVGHTPAPSLGAVNFTELYQDHLRVKPSDSSSSESRSQTPSFNVEQLPAPKLLMFWNWYLILRNPRLAASSSTAIRETPENSDTFSSTTSKKGWI